MELKECYIFKEYYDLNFFVNKQNHLSTLNERATALYLSYLIIYVRCTRNFLQFLILTNSSIFPMCNSSNTSSTIFSYRNPNFQHLQIYQ